MFLSTHALLSSDEAVAHEQKELGGDGNFVAQAMRAAGEAVGRAILEDFAVCGTLPESPSILVLAGSGHNAGDALHATRVIRSARPTCRIVILRPAGAGDYRPLTASALETLVGDGAGVELLEDGPDARRLLERHPAFDIRIDGLLGMSFKPPLRDNYADLISWADGERMPRARMRVAVDLPSGATTDGEGPVLQSDFTYATAFAKRPLPADSVLPFAGRVRVLTIPQITPPEDPSADQVVLPASLRHLAELRPAVSHKRDYGHVLILAGSITMPGAALMATQGALHAGSGLVTTFCPANVAPRLMGQAPEAMWQPVPLMPDGNFDNEVVKMVHQASASGNVLLIGPGLRLDRSGLYNICRIVRESPLPLVVDASALVPEVLNAVLARPAVAGPVVLTPHFGEYGRVNPQRSEGFEPDSMRQFCQKYKLTTLLKGPVCRLCDGGPIWHIPTGGPVLARGGSGDILAGMLATLLAQNPGNPMEVAAMAALWHGEAARQSARDRGERAVRSTDILTYLSRVTR